MDLEGTIEKVQESSPVLMQARNLPGGPRRYYRKSAGKFTCTGAGQEPPRRYLEKVQESSPVLVQARDLPGGPRRYYRKSAGNFICTGVGQEPSRWT